jgi:hypothetical protein
MTLHMQELTIGLNILSNLKDCGRICGDFIFTAVCRVKPTHQVHDSKKGILEQF